MDAIENLLRGSIDMHIHHGPDPKGAPRLDALQLALQAEQAGMRGIVLKSHEYPTAPLANTVGKQVRNLSIFGSICLNLEVGGLNTHALEASAMLGARVAWMPTFSSANHIRKKGLTAEGISILDKAGKLLPVMKDILDIIKNYNMVLATGHISLVEASVLVDGAARKGLKKIVITHPLLEAPDSLEEQVRMAQKGAFIEHCICHTMPVMPRVTPMTMVEAIRAVGAERCIMSTDLGWTISPAPAEGMRTMIDTMLRCGLTQREMELMIKVNPARLLDLN